MGAPEAGMEEGQDGKGKVTFYIES
jgi:hypothetical protein